MEVTTMTDVVTTTQTVQPTRLVRTPHPLTTQGQTSVAVLQQDGETLLSLLQRHHVDSTWVVEVGGLPVPAIMWARVRVHHGQVIECRSVVQKDVIKLVAFVALAWFTMGAGGFAAGALGGSTWGIGQFAAHMLGAVAFAAGAMVINRILPPPKAPTMDAASNSVEPTYSLSGGRNSQRLWQPISLVLGQPYAVFDLAAQPYSYFGGDDQYLQQIFHLGINCQRVDALRIGQTELSNFEGVSIAATGLPGNSYSTAMPSNNVDSISGALLDAPNGTGPWVTRTTSPGTAQICIDIEANLYGTNSSTGVWDERQCDIELQYAEAGSGSWVGVSTGTTRRVQETYTENGWYNIGAGENMDSVWGPIQKTRWVEVSSPVGTAWLSSSTAKPLRRTFTVQVPSGQYDVRLRKITANETTTSGQNAVQWIQLRSFQAQTTSFPGQALLAVNIKASGQLSGAIDELNGILTAKTCPHWDGSAWVTATDRTNGLSNPGTIMLAYARGFYDENNRLMAGLGWPDSRIDLDSIKGFTVWCARRGFTFDAHIQEAMTHADLLDAVAYAGMGSVCQPDGKLGVQWLADDAPVEGVINMGNIKAKTFSVQYDLNDRADEIEYGYFDRAQGNRWNALRVLAPGVTMPRSTARLSNMGITSEAHAAVLARHSMAQNIYMAKAITFEQDLEHLTYRRGTVLSLSHDMTVWGYSGRVQSVTDAGGVITLGLDDAVPATGPGGAGNKFIGLRLLGEAQYRIFQVQAFTGTARSVTLVGAWPAGVPLPGANGQVHDALWVFDFKATPGLKVVVSKVEPMGGMTGAQVTVVPLPDEFWPFVNSGAYTPPPNRSLLSVTPAISNLRANEILRRQGNAYAVDLSVRFDAGDAVDQVQVWGARGGEPLRLLGATRSREFAWAGALSDEWYLKLVPISAMGIKGAEQSVYYAVAGLTLPASDVTGFAVSIESGGVRLSWDLCPDVDYAKTVLKIGNSWAGGEALAEKLSTDHLLPFFAVGSYKFWAAHVDTSGNASTTPASATLTITNPAPVQGLVLACDTTGLAAHWAMPALAATEQPIDRVELSWSVNFASIIQSTKATSVPLPWVTPGFKELFVRAVDMAGNVGAIASATLVVRSPSAPVGLAVAIGTTGAVVSWGAPAVAADQQPLGGLQLSYFADFSNVIETRSATSVELGWLTADTRTLYARYTDVAGNSGSAASLTFTVNAPSAPASLQIGFGTSSIEAAWQAPTVAAQQQSLERVELSWGSAFTSIIDGRKATTTTFGWMPAGTHTLHARYVDMAGNVGAVSQATLQVLAPAQVVMTAVETQVNLVTLRWQDAKTSQPIRKYAIYYGEAGTSVAAAALYGSAGADSRSDILQYRSSGAKVAYLVAEDVAGNLGTARQIDLNIKMPDNFVLATEYYEDWQPSELTNGTIMGGSTGQIVLPAYDGRTWGQRLSNNGWTTAQQKIDAGYPVLVQPVPTSGKHVERKDCGKVIATSVVRVTPTVLGSSVAGYTPTIRIRASVGASTASWQPWLVGDSASFSDFQHVEVEYSVTSDGKGFVVLDDLYVKVEVTEVTESATLVLNPADAAGTAYTCTKPFLDVRAVQVTPVGANSMARPPYYVIDDSTLPAKVYVFAHDASNNRTGGTVSLFITGV